MDTGKTDTDVIFWTRIERSFVHEHQRLVVVDDVGRLVVKGRVGCDIQTTGGITVVAGELLLGNKPVTVFAVVHAVALTGGGSVGTVDVFTQVIGRSCALVVAHTVFTRQVVDLRRPDQFDWQQNGALVPLPLSLKPLPCSSCDGFWL